ncbi:M23 family metallopeptidase [Salinibacter sp.]|uniref:M23 family metallopeptidase n=1 Tax=Salinibacter sp. TaxID=2065818 RepID=UPI0021E70576|nr:M23 family metallopeptidase [Salinibacter sp.]
MGVAFLLVGLFAGACDQLTGSSSPESERLEAKALTFSHMPMGNTLPSPDEVPLERGMVRPDQEPTTQAQPRLPRSKETAKKAGTPSPYGCYLASRPYSEAVAFRSVYLYFPRDMVKEAGEEKKRIVFSLEAALIEASVSAAKSDPAEAAAQREETGVRYANCVIPATSGAEDIANEQLIRAGEEEAVLNAVGSPEKPASKNQVCTIEQVTTCAGWSWNESCGTEYEVSCGSSIPGGGAGGLGGGYPDGGDGVGGGGSGGADGDENRSCESTKSLSKRLYPGSSGPGSECPPAEPPDDDVDETEVCPQDPLKDMDIRATCAGIEGGTYGDTRGPNNNQFHGGLDLDADKGTELFAIERGEVVQVDYLDDFGDYVVVQSSQNENQYFLYAHLSSTAVGEDDAVVQGRKLGETGKSGNAEEAECNQEHLHLEVREGDGTDLGWVKDLGGETVDPEEYIGTNFNEEGEAKSDQCS